jgi:hypothetical protein
MFRLGANALTAKTIVVYVRRNDEAMAGCYAIVGA